MIPSDRVILEPSQSAGRTFHVFTKDRVYYLGQLIDLKDGWHAWPAAEHANGKFFVTRDEATDYLLKSLKNRREK